MNNEIPTITTIAPIPIPSAVPLLSPLSPAAVCVGLITVGVGAVGTWTGC
jgi:hypothetical protein